MPAPYTDINQHYAQNPWEAVTTNQRSPWYYPELYKQHVRKSIYNDYVSVQFNHNGPHATELVVTSTIDAHPNHDPIGVRQAWLDSSYVDSLSRKITFSRHAAKLSLNRYEKIVTYWLENGEQ